MFFCLFAAEASAQTVTPATGGNAISADNTGGAYTTLTGPVYSEGASANAGTGTIILIAPTGFEFDTGGTAPTVLVTRTGGAGGNNRNINDVASGTSVAVTSVTTTQITFTVTAASSNGVTNTLTWQNVRVRPTAGTPLASGNITKSGTSAMTGVTGTTNFGTLTEVPGAVNKLVITLPGQSFVAGTGSTGSPTSQTADGEFTISSIHATDQYFNVVTTYSGAKTLSYSGPGGNPSYTTGVSFSSGVSTTTLTTTLRKAETTTITASDGTAIGPASSSLTVNPGAFAKLQLLVPGETADPGSITGKTGTPAAQTAGGSFTATVNAVDANWNPVSATDEIGITSSDIHATIPGNSNLVGGTQNFNIILKTAGSATITATDITDVGKLPSTSPSITVNPGAFVKLQVLVPGETTDPGSSTGKTGSPSDQTAGSSLAVTVNAVDTYWNVVSSTNTVNISSSDANAVLPADAALVGGTQNFSVTFKTAGTATVTATNVTDPTKTADSSPSIAVNPGAFTKLQILMPGEAANPGSATGKTGTPDPQTAGIAFVLTVHSVDAGWNIVNSNHTVGITSSDPLAGLPFNAALANGTQTFNVAFNTAGTATVTASDITDPSKTADTSPSITVNPAGTGTLTAATGGGAIPADDAGGSYTTLTGPLYEEGGSGNISTGTITLNVPSGFEFDAGGLAPTLLIQRIGGSGPDSDNINDVSSGTAISATSVTSSAVTFTITSPSTNGVKNSVTWQDIRVRPMAGTPLASANITMTGTATIAGVTGSTNFGTLTEVPGAFARFYVTLPGETFSEGSGNSGTVSSQTAGTAFNLVSLTATDQFVNIVTSYAGVKTISYSGPGGETNFTTAVSFTSGVSTTTLPTTLRRAETTTITASEGAVTGPASSGLTVDAAVFTSLQLLVPGESADPGTTTGKTGTPSSQIAGTSFQVIVNAVDDYQNLVNSGHTIRITSSDVYAVLPADAALSAGTQNFSITFRTAGTATITAENLTDPTKTQETSPSITVNPGAFVKMQILVPGETADPGSPTGKTGTPVAQAIGSPFTVTVNAVDADWNLVNSTHTVRITSSDGAATIPPDAALVGGTKDFSVIFNTTGTQTVTASNLTDPTKTASTSPGINVAAVVITPTTGGSAISADDVGGAYTSLTGPAYDEAASGDAGVGTIILDVASGFEFDIGGAAPTVLITRISGGGGNNRNINSVASGTSVAVSSVSSTQVVFTITSASNSGVTNRLTWQNLRVRPTSGTPLASGSMTKSGTSTVTGIVAGVTNLGTLTEVHGALAHLVITLPDETFTEGGGNSGTPTDQVAGTAFDITRITATDQFLNITASYAGTKTLSYTGPTGSASYTTGVDFSTGQSTTTLATTLNTVETTTITVDDGTVSGPASSLLTVNAPTKTWDGGAATANWGDAANWNPDGVPSSLNDVDLSTASTIVVDIAADTKNITLNSGGLTLTIQAGFSMTVAGNYSHQAGTLNTEASFPAVSGSVSITGGTVGYTASSGSQIVSARAYQNLVISGGGTKTLAGNSTIANDLTISGGILVLGTSSLNRLVPGGSLTLSSGASLHVGGSSGGVSGSNFPENFTTRFLSGTVDFNRGGDQSVPPYVFTDLTLSNSGTKFFGSGTSTIGGVFSITGSASADFTTNATTVEYTNTVAQSIQPASYDNLVLTGGAKTFLGDISTSGFFTNASVTSAGTYILTVIGSKSNTGTMLFSGAANGVSFTGGIVEYNGAVAQTVAQGTYGTLVFSNTGVKTCTNDLTVQSTVTIPAGVEVIVDPGVTVDIGGNLDLGGTLTNNGIINVGN